ncbi:type I restriction endonuclease S subunit [Bacteroides caccae]|uniref:Type I restriction endonuclease S subunit n=1 Tax=Bacteroides caccae TaxID=47678 RepID=A0A174HXJ9_9BACE|nr:restriction endonuclease subunit S [Bacteroides caccae]UVQ04726.1 restriction endonuclease subunit S [Bacteroides caccae]CUO79613.1 type I restriction endonuclease S subunit [Bacteroides caccae]
MKNNNENKILNVPNLRFPEFSGEWENCQIANILSIGSGRDYKHLEKGNIPVFGTGGYMTSVNECIYDGETTFIGRKGSINKPFYYNGKFWTVDTLFYTHSFNKTTPKFVYCLFQTINWLRYNEASGVPSLSKDTIEKIKVFIPQLDEQRKISEMLSVIDERIATQNKIIEDLKKLKSAIYQEIFSNLQGEECSLLDLAEIIKGQQINGSELSDSGKYYVMNGGIAPSGYYDSYNTEADTISISEGGNSCGYVQYNSSEFWSGGHCYTLRIKPTSSIATHFLFHYLKWKEPDIMALRIGSGLPNIQKKDLSKISIIVPTLDKQLQLTVLLSAFKKKIENEEMYVANLDKQKQYLLQQMFI